MTIAFNHLGRMGQLGNQMFQYASLKGIARNRGRDYMIPNNTEVVVDSLGNRLRTEIFRPFDLHPELRVGILETQQYVQEPHFHFSNELFSSCPDNVSLVGYFQTPRYFNHIRYEILEDFKFKSHILEPCEEMMEGIDEPIALHIRRGDFITNVENHFNQSLEYYEEALKQFDNNRQVIIFSDDIPWCKEQDLFKGDRFMVSESGDPDIDMCLMTLCHSFIIANSTFSWWPAWLSIKGAATGNLTKKVIYPKQWFGITGYTKDHNVSDLFPEEWIKL